MKLNRMAFFGAMISTSLLAQQSTNPPAASSPAPAAVPAVANPTAPAVVSPAASAEKKKPAATKPTAAKKKNPAAELRTVPLVPGPAVVDANHVNVRGQARLKSEIVARLNKGQPVTVIEEIVRQNAAIDEPSAWAKIVLPTNAHVWVHSSYIEPTNKTVIPKKLNLRSGPGENYSVIGQLQRGDLVAELGAKGLWTEIIPPPHAYAFVAAQFLKQEPPATAPVTPTEVATTPPVTPTEPATPPAEHVTVTEPPAVAVAPTEPLVTAPVIPQTEAPAVTNAPTQVATTEAPATPEVEEPPPPRIVEREGIVRGTGSIQAPTHFALYNPQNGRLVDYLYTPSPYLDLRRYKGLRIIVRGEEGLEERWGNTPVLTIQKIEVLDD